MKVNHVRGEKTNESEPLKLPGPFMTIHRPILVSCPTPATSKTESFLASPHEKVTPFGTDKSWIELTTHGAFTHPTKENDFNLWSSFHNLIWPSHEPGSR